MFENFGVLPALREGIGHIQDDERRHIAYGTYLCRRIIASDHDLAEVGIEKMYELRDMYTQGFFGARMVAEEGNGQKPRAGAEEIITQMRKQAEEERQAEQARGNGGGGYGGGGGDFTIFGEVMIRQVDRRVALLRNATKVDSATAERGEGAEEIERELETVS
jgi:hypothetical protein